MPNEKLPDTVIEKDLAFSALEIFSNALLSFLIQMDSLLVIVFAMLCKLTHLLIIMVVVINKDNASAGSELCFSSIHCRFLLIAVPFKVVERPAGKSRHHYRRLTELAVTGFISFSDVPLRIWGLIGLVISFFSFCSVIYIIINTLLHGPSVPGYATLMVTIVFFGGIQLLSIGIVGEYVARIFHEVKRRPSYIIEKKIGIEPDDETTSS